jgi:hypothetical protein
MYYKEFEVYKFISFQYTSGFITYSSVTSYT